VGETDSHALAKKKRGRPPKVRVQPFLVPQSSIEGAVTEFGLAPSSPISDVMMQEEPLIGRRSDYFKRSSSSSKEEIKVYENES
jgi:hypothetical protein